MVRCILFKTKCVFLTLTIEQLEFVYKNTLRFNGIIIVVADWAGLHDNGDAYNPGIFFKIPSH